MFEILTTDEFDRWLSDLADERARTKIASRVARLRFGNAGDVKPVGEGVSEMRVHHGRDTASITSKWKERSSSFCAVEISRAKPRISSERRKLLLNCERTAMIKISKFEAANYLKSPQAMADYLSEALATDDPEFICDALDTIARAKGMTQVAKETGLSRESLYKSLSGTTKPEFDTIRKVINSFGLRLVAEPIDKTEVA
ncbi:addiction module antidote protein [Bradyrhizobium sp. BWA-3-5]|uniref:addiction module antidote protein n=1 Tax=Bradyrhizobium sp. BWA-3-5 TaxID=3080013 RepID=UPI00293EF7B7|nr:addiction module antidote protein [Bradyrhizobium sp. BWA-3-5]WOH68757.1 putative addiction module antidote protein [Bradyrhizobium sp. BWA-3-5]